MACPNEMNKEEKEQKKSVNINSCCYEIRERREGYIVKMIPSVSDWVFRRWNEATEKQFEKLFDN